MPAQLNAGQAIIIYFIMNILIAVIIFLLYTVTVCYIYGIPKTLSQSVFNYPKAFHWIWVIVLASIAFLCVPSYIENTSENTQFIAFIAIASLVFVGAAPLVKDTQDIAFKVHSVAAVICAVCSQLTIILNKPAILLTWFPWILAFSIYYNRGNKWNTKVFWAEMVCFGSTFIYCLI